MASSNPAEPGDRVVLLVEDEVVLRSSMMRGLLKLPRVEVLDAGSVAEALRVTERVRPAVMICDIDLPDGSGLELLSQLERQGRRVPTVFVTAYLPRFRQQLAQRPGVTMLEKPVALSLLREIVVQHLGDDVAARPSPFLLTDYIQLAAMGQRTVQLDVARDGHRLGEVVLRDGEAWHAQDAQGTGIDALMRLMHEPDVTVSNTAPPEESLPARTLLGSGEHALLEAARRFDESRTPPPPQARVDDELAAALDAALSRSTVRGPTPTGKGTLPYLVASVGSAGSAAGQGGHGGAPNVAVTHPPPAMTSFADLYERGIDALLSKDYATAYGLLVRASQLGTSTSLEANLRRLRAMGFGP